MNDKELQRKRLEKIRQESEAHRKSQDQNVHHSHVRKNQTKIAVIAGIGIVLILILGYLAYSMSLPGYYDSFAQCLSDKGVVVYGNLNTCVYTQGQKAMFGKSFKYLNYYDMSKWPADKYGEIKVTPTWIINGEIYPNVQNMDRLASLTGCSVSPDQA